MELLVNLNRRIKGQTHRIWNDVVSSSVTNDSDFEKWFLAHCYALRETEHLTSGNQVTILSELPIVNFLTLSDPSTIMLGVHSNVHHQIPSSNESNLSEIRLNHL